jgi:hypothetical protein
VRHARVVGDRRNPGRLVDGDEVFGPIEYLHRAIDRNRRWGDDDRISDAHGIGRRRRTMAPDEHSTVAQRAGVGTRAYQHLSDRAAIAGVDDPPDAPLRHARAPRSVDR